MHTVNIIERKVVLATGGPGGHVFPSQALAETLMAQGMKVFIFTDERGGHHLESNKTNSQNELEKGPTIVKIPADQLQGSFIKKLKAGAKLIRGVGTAFYHLRRLKPQVVIGFGGYASSPTLIAATLLRLPIIVHQADAYLGRTNRLLAPFVTRIATSFPHVENIPSASQKKVDFTGLPIRSEVQSAPYIASEGDDPFYLLITGGSQGARVFGEIVPEAIRLLSPSLQKRLHITQQCRPESLKITQALYATTSVQAELSPFLDQMGERYKKANLVISRAGASSVIEAALVGRPAIFVPFPYAMNDHQFYNAQQAVKVEGGWMMREKEFTSKALAILLSDLITSPWKLTQAAVNIQTIARSDASLRLAHLVNLSP